MSIIDGVGNEVTQFFFVVGCGLVALLAWWSTGQRHNNRIGTAVILARNIHRVVHHGTNTVIQPVPAAEESLTSQSSVETTSSELLDEQCDDQTASVIQNETSSDSQSPLSVQSVEMNNIVDAMDSEASILRNRRLAFFSNRTEPNNGERQNAPDSSTSCSDETSTLIDSDAEPVSEPTVVNNPEEDVKDGNIECDDADNIRIKLKYLNDDIKFVDGKLHEPLGEFKRRHFKGELSARKLVRLIFNGQVLKPEAATLQSCGLFDNCVVHCLVHQPKTPQQYTQVQQQLGVHPIPGNVSGIGQLDGQGASPSSQIDADGQDDRDWDLNHVLFTLIASLLTGGWYIHVRFSGFFGIAASLAMLSLTVLYFIALIGVYFPEIQPRTNARNPATPPNATEGEPTTTTTAAE